MQATNHPKGNFLRKQLSWVKLSGDIYLRSNRLMDNYPGSNCSEGGRGGGEIFQGTIIRWTNFLGGSYPPEQLPVVREESSMGQLSRGQFSSGEFVRKTIKFYLFIESLSV